MKTFIIGLSMFVLSMMFTVYQHDYHLHQDHVHKLHFAAEEASAAAAQYLVNQSYSEGEIVFRQAEGIKAAKYILQQQLKVDEQMAPLLNSYWQEQVKWKIEFFDDSNTTFPFLYHHEAESFVYTLSQPSVIITVNPGKPRYRLINTKASTTSIAIYELKER